jgi:hypothetical protein
MKNWQFLVFGLVFALLPFIIVFMNGVSLVRPVSEVYISGFITASGVFLGFLVNIMFRSDFKLHRDLRASILVNVGLFLFALSVAFGNAIVGTPNVLVLAFLASSLNVNIFQVVVFSEVFASVRSGIDKVR